MSVPSVVFAEATWYGSLRGGLETGGGGDGQFFDGSSRWGVKGSAEASEGLTAVYRFEASVSTKDATQGGRLAYAGLSGGFGSISVGQIWNAAYNHAGAITDKSYYFGNSTTGYRHGNALSYAYSSGALGFQLDLISDGDMDTGKAIDKTEFGMTIGLGEVGKVALAHTNQRDKTVTKMTEYVPSVPGTPYVPAGPDTEAMDATYWVDHDDDDDTDNIDVDKIEVLMSNVAAGTAANLDGDKLTDDGLNAITLEADGTYVIGTGAGALTPDTVSNDCQAAAKTEATTDDCKTVTAYVRTVKTVAPTDGTNSVTVATTETRTFYAEAEEKMAAVTAAPAVNESEEELGEPEKAPVKFVETHPGHKNTHVAVEFNVGGMTPYLGYSVKKTNKGMMLQDKNKDKMLTEDEFLEVKATKTKTTHYGISGGLGDTGVNFLVAARSVDKGGTKTSPWLFNVSKNLGGGATVIFEHANYDNDEPGNKETAIGLHVSF